MSNDLTERERQIADNVCESLDPRYRKTIVAAWMILAIFVVGGGIICWQLVEKANEQGETITLNTDRIVGVEQIVGALKGLNKHESRVLFNKLLRNRTARQKALTRGKRGKRGEAGVRVLPQPPPSRKSVARTPRRPALPLAPLSMGEQIARDTCAQIHAAMPQAVC